MKPAGVVLVTFVLIATGSDARADDWRRKLRAGEYELAQGREEHGGRVIRQALAAAGREDARDEAVVRGLLSLAGIEKTHDRSDDAEATLRRALTLAESLPARRPLAGVLLSLADLFRFRGRLDDAEPLVARALALTEADADPASVASADALHVLATLRTAAGQREEADWLFRRALNIKESALGRDHPDLAPLLTDYGVALEDSGRGAEAEDALRRALAIHEREHGGTGAQVGLVSTLNALGAHSEAKEDLAEAEKLYRRAVAVADTHPREGLAGATSLNNLAGVLCERGERKEAKRLAQRALKVWEKALGPYHSKLGEGLNTLGRLQAAEGDYVHAERLFRRASRLAEVGEGNGGLRAATLANRGAIRLLMNSPQEAEPFFERGLEIAEEALGADHPALVRLLHMTAECYRLRARPTLAESQYERALRLAERAHGEAHPSVMPGLAGLALVAEMRGHVERAEWFHRRALTLAEQALPPRHPDRAVYLSNLATFYRMTGKAVRAEPLYVSALAILEGTDARDPRREAVLEGLASVYAMLGRSAEATRMERRLARTRPGPALVNEPPQIAGVVPASSPAP